MFIVALLAVLLVNQAVDSANSPATQARIEAYRAARQPAPIVEMVNDPEPAKPMWQCSNCLK